LDTETDEEGEITILWNHSEITVVFMGKSNSSIRHEIPRG
jgi:hypothetical protein